MTQEETPKQTSNLIVESGDPEELTLELLKQKIGLRSDVRDSLLRTMIGSIITELRDVHKITIDLSNDYQQMFVLDWAEWRYLNRGSFESMPRYIRHRLNNMIFKRIVTKEE